MFAKFAGFFGAGLVVAALAAGPVRADEKIYEDLSGPEIVALLDAHGYDASLTADRYGDPEIMGAVDGLGFKIKTYDCDKQAPRRCKSLQFVAAFALQRKPTSEDFIAMNEYNKKKIYGRAFIDDNGDAAIDFVIDLTGGVSTSSLMNDVSTWKDYVLDVFVEHLGWKTS